MYGDIKMQVLSLFPFSYDATLIVLGLMIWLLSGLVFRLPMTRLICVDTYYYFGCGNGNCRCDVSVSGTDPGCQ